MTPSIAEANATLRQAVEIRRENQAAGKPLEEWYASKGETDSFQPVTETLPEVSSHATFAYDAETMKAARDWVAARDEFAEFESSNWRPGSLPFLELLEEVRRRLRALRAPPRPAQRARRRARRRADSCCFASRHLTACSGCWAAWWRLASRAPSAGAWRGR